MTRSLPIVSTLKWDALRNLADSTTPCFLTLQLSSCFKLFPTLPCEVALGEQIKAFPLHDGGGAFVVIDVEDKERFSSWADK